MKNAVKGGIAALGIAGAMAAGVTLTTGTAHADASSDLAYVQALNNSGVNIYNTAEVIQTGHMICQRLNFENGADTARYVYTHSSYSDIPTMAWAGVWVVDAAQTICPWQWHG